MNADISNKPAQSPGLKHPDPWKMFKSKWPHSNRQKTGETAGAALGWKRKTTTLVGEKRETKHQNKRKNVEPRGKDHMTLPSGGRVLGPLLELPVSISCLINRYYRLKSLKSVKTFWNSFPSFIRQCPSWGCRDREWSHEQQNDGSFLKRRKTPSRKSVLMPVLKGWKYSTNTS
jgi:hypothetical protein